MCYNVLNNEGQMITKKCGNCIHFPKAIRHEGWGVCAMDMRTIPDHPACKLWKGKKYVRKKIKISEEKNDNV